MSLFICALHVPPNQLVERARACGREDEGKQGSEHAEAREKHRRRARESEETSDRERKRGGDMEEARERERIGQKRGRKA